MDGPYGAALDYPKIDVFQTTSTSNGLCSVLKVVSEPAVVRYIVGIIVTL